MRRLRRAGAAPRVPAAIVGPRRRLAEGIARDHAPGAIIDAATALARNHGIELQGMTAIDGLAADLARSGLDPRAENGRTRVRLQPDAPGDNLSTPGIRIAGATPDLSIGIDADARGPLLAPVISADWLWSGRRERQPLTADHVRDAIRVSQAIGTCSLAASGLFLSAVDLPLQERIAAAADGDPRPLLVETRPDVPLAVLGAACREARPGRVDGSSALIAVVRLERSLQFGADVLTAIATLARSKETIILAPTLLLGANCPLAVTGALVRFTAEIMVGAAIARAVAPDARLLAGVTVAEASMRTGLPQTGTALALTTLAGAIAIARRLGLPIAALGPPTARNGVDSRAAVETAAWLTVAMEADLVIGAFGAIELDAGFSLEKMLIDADSAENLLGGTADRATPAEWADELAALGPGGIALQAPSTRDRARRQPSRMLPEEALFEVWTAAGAPDALEQAALAVAELLREPRQGDGAPRSGADAAVPSPAPAVSVPRPGRLSDLASGLYSAALREAFGFKG